MKVWQGVGHQLEMEKGGRAGDWEEGRGRERRRGLRGAKKEGRGGGARLRQVGWGEENCLVHPKPIGLAGSPV